MADIISPPHHPQTDASWTSVNDMIDGRQVRSGYRTVRPRSRSERLDLRPRDQMQPDEKLFDRRQVNERNADPKP